MSTREDILSLAPCPFCGGSQLSEGGRSWVVCHGCGAEGPFDPKPGAKAAAAWNRRAAPTPPAARPEAAIRNEVLEEAAKVAEANMHSSIMPGHVGQNIAAELRDRIEQMVMAAPNPFDAVEFKFVPAASPHDPSYVLAADEQGSGPMIPVNGHGDYKVDDARAKWVAETLNAALAAAPTPPAAEAPGQEPIETDEHDPSRQYIPLPAGWEIQTKGRGSSFRLLDRKTGERMSILLNDGQPGHELVTRMAVEIHAECAKAAGIPVREG